MRSFSMSAVLSLVVAACLLCADAQAGRRRAPQAPRPPQGPQCRVEPTPSVKTCPCSTECVCGCNSGQPCDCKVTTTSSGKVGGMVCEGGVCRMVDTPQYSQSTPQTVTYSYAPASGGSCASGNCGQSSGSSMTSSCSSGSCSSGNCGSSGRVAILRRRR